MGGMKIEKLMCECVPQSDSDSTMWPVMIPDKDGYWMSVGQHENIVYELKQRITYLENCNVELSEQLCR